MSRPLDTMVDAFQDELKKIANAVTTASKLRPSAKTLGIAGGSVLGFEAMRRANEDRKTGRQFRLQNNGGGIF